MLLAGPNVKAGLHGRMPSLTALEDDNLAWCVDFRRIYATLLPWLGMPADGVLGAKFEPLDLLRS